MWDEGHIGHRGETRTFAQPALIHRIFEERVRCFPLDGALKFAGRHVLYANANADANRLARWLAGRGIGRGDLVGLCLEPSVELIVALLAVLKTGAGFVPLDSDHPRDRLEFVASDSRVCAVLSNRATREACPAGSFPVLDLDAARDKISVMADGNLDTEGAPNDVMYVMYTSGSTGLPKGAILTHAGIRNRLLWGIGEYELGVGDGVLFKTSIAFDVCIWEIFAPLLSGADLVIAKPGGNKDVSYLIDLIDAEKVTHADFVPSMMSAFLSVLEPGDCASLRLVTCAGESLTASLLDQIFAALQVKVYNLYGPTEASLAVTYWSCTATPDDREVPIGRPMSNIALYIVDSDGRLAREGELYIGGIAPGLGYLNLPDKTMDSFIPDRFSGDGTLYRTGDLVRARTDGALMFLGRADDQVKLRGMRIELGEIESQLASNPLVRDVVVVVREFGVDDQRLVAFVVLRAGVSQVGDPSRLLEQLRSPLLTILPAPMVPAHFAIIESIPLTPNGKADRKALEKTPTSRTSMWVQQADAGDAARKIENHLIEFWCEVLGLDSVSSTDDFFALGGHSLLAIRIIVRIKADLHCEISVGELFERGTIRSLAELIMSRNSATVVMQDAGPPLRPGDGDLLNGRVTLSWGQRRLWALDQIEGPNAAYNIPLAWRLLGQLDCEALAAALTDLVARHTPLRTIIETVDGVCFGRLQPPPTPQELLEREDLCGLQAAERERALTAAIAAEAARPFNLAADFLLRGRVIRLGPRAHVLVLVIHHAAGDGFSQAVFIKELAAAYAARSCNNSPDFSALPIHYADYAAWQQSWLEQGGALTGQINYWVNRLSGGPDLLRLPSDRPRDPGRSHHAGNFPLRIELDLVQRIDALARQHHTTLFTVLLAGYAATLGRIAGQDDIVIGTPVAGRSRIEVENLIGFFVNTLALRFDLSGDPDTATLVARARGTVFDALANQDLPFERLIEEIAPPRSLAQTPLFQAVFAWQSQESASLALPGLTALAIPVELPRAKFDLTLNLSPQLNGSLDGSIEYDASLFDEATITRWTNFLIRTLEGMSTCANPDGAQGGMPVARMPILDAEERRLVLERFNDTADETPEATLAALFEAQVARASDAIALVYEDQQLTYAELEASANRLARHLIAQGIGPESLVGVALERSIELVVALLAIVKAGGAYLPLDASFPPARLQFMLQDARPVCVLTTSDLADRLGDSTPLLPLDDPAVAAVLAERSDTAPTDADRTAPFGPQNLAYVIFTSGSTGTPKGVMASQANVVSLAWRPSYAVIGPDQVLLQFAPLAFDAATFEIWGALLNGARLVLAPAGAPDMDRLAETISRNGIDTMWLTASLFRHISETRPWMLGRLKQLLAGGETLPPTSVARIMAQYPELVVINGYGPTETTTFACTHRIARSEADALRIPIGAPIRNMQAYVLDASLSPVPVGVAGELYIAGAGLTRGYLNRPELTAERFIPSPFGPSPFGPPGTRMYRTGDLARWRMDGVLDFLGRTDQQLKIRGFRIEPGEIEVALTSIKGVGQAAVVPREIAGETRLVAYLVTAPGKILPDAGALRAALADRLPDYMLPSVFMSLDTLPLTPNGKLDRRALPTPDVMGEAVYRAPRNPRETVLCRLFAELTGAARVGLDDNFFDLGGHSLLGIRLMAEIEKMFGRTLPLGALFSAPTVKLLAGVLVQDDVKSPWISLVPLQTEGSGIPIFMVHWIGRDLAGHLGRTRPVYGLSYGLPVGAAPDKPAVPETIEAFASQYIQEMRSLQPFGPYQLIGHSFGGLVAYEMAQQLVAQHQRVALLGLLDTYAPGVAAKRDFLPLREQISNLWKAPAPELLRRARQYIRDKFAYCWSSRLPTLFLEAENLANKYKPKPYAGKVHFFKSKTEFSSLRTAPPPSAECSWIGLARGGIEVHETPGDHDNMVKDPIAGLLAAQIDACLIELQADRR